MSSIDVNDITRELRIAVVEPWYCLCGISFHKLKTSYEIASRYMVVEMHYSNMGQVSIHTRVSHLNVINCSLGISVFEQVECH